MRRWPQVGFSIILLARAAHATEVKLEIAPPEPLWLLPPSSQPCRSALGQRLEACTTQLQPEGIPTVEEGGLVIDLEPLLAARDYEAALERIRLNYGPELALLEAGDVEGFLRTRLPTAGGDQPSVPDNLFAQRRGMTLGPDTISASMLYLIGHSYLALDRYLPAETAFKLALTALPDHVRAHESLGTLYLRTERYADARRHLARAVQLGRNTAHVHVALGYLEQKTHHYWAAANAFQRALVLEPKHRSARRGLLHALTATREHAKARALVEELLMGEPEDVELWLYRAQIALAAKQDAVALASLETALRLGDDSIANRRSCAALHIESGSIARAVELLKGAASRELDFRLVDKALVWLASENRWDDYRELYDSVDRSALDSAEQSRLLTRRAMLAERNDNVRAARTALQEAVALDPSNADALVALGRIRRAEGDLGRADLLLRHASMYPSAREVSLVALAGVAIEQEDFDAALEFLVDATAASPGRGELRRNIRLLEEIVLTRTER